MKFDWKSRKLWAAIVSSIVALLVSGGYIGEMQGDQLGEMVLMILGIFGIYVAGNVGEHIARSKAPQLTPEEIQSVARALKEFELKGNGWEDKAKDALWGGIKKLVPFI